MSLSAKKRSAPKPVMNVTPLVDVVLVLLIIFMVVIPMMDKNPNVRVPDIFNTDEEAKGKTDPYTLSLTTTGEMWFEEEKLDDTGFEARLRKANQEDPSRRLVLRADRETKYGDVRALFKICQGIGFPGISMRANPLKGDTRTN